MTKQNALQQFQARTGRTPLQETPTVAELRVFTADEQGQHEAEFQANRELVWLRIWSRALKLARLNAGIN
jgi:hypothetical protein